MTAARDQTSLTSGIAFGVVCPMANEAETAVAFVEEILAACEDHGFKSVDFFVVLDKASKDHTRELLQQLAITRPALHVVWAPENKNIVEAYVRGYRETLSAGCDWILEIDAGYSHQPSDLHKFFAKIPEGYSCVFGSRFIEGGAMSESTLQRRVISRGGTILANAMLGTKLTDMTSGYEMFSRSVLENVLARGIQSQGPFFQTEIKAYCREVPAVEVPIHYRTPSHNINNTSLKDAFVNLWRLFRLRIAGRL